eukprot:jgi/Undpi1/11714/HiC_scaffold_37.g14009.m1
MTKSTKLSRGAVTPLLLLSACVTTGGPSWTWRDAKLETATFDSSGRPAPARGRLGGLVWGLGPGLVDRDRDQSFLDAAWEDPQKQDPRAQDPKAGPQPGGQDPQDPAERRSQEARIRAQFGSGVIILSDGRVTQQYPFVGESALVFLKLIATPDQPEPGLKAFTAKKVGGAGAKSILGQMLRERSVEISFVPKFSKLTGVEIAHNPKKPIVTGKAPNPQGTLESHLVLVTGQPSSVLAFERSLDLFYANIPQVQIDVQVIESTTADALTFGVESLNSGTNTITNLNSKQLVQGFTADFPIRQPVVGANPVTDAGTFALGGIHDAWELAAQIKVLESKNLANVESSPSLVVRNGGMATVSTYTELPFPKARISTNGANTTTDIQFKPVGVAMNIHPTIAGTQTVILQISASVSAVTGFAATEPVDTPIISDRSTTTTVHVNHNESVVIGGLVSESSFESETKVPILGDIPILGYLFRSTSESTNRTELIFVITPKIVRAGEIRYEQIDG